MGELYHLPRRARSGALERLPPLIDVIEGPTLASARDAAVHRKLVSFRSSEPSFLLFPENDPRLSALATSIGWTQIGNIGPQYKTVFLRIVGKVGVIFARQPKRLYQGAALIYDADERPWQWMVRGPHEFA